METACVALVSERYRNGTLLREAIGGVRSTNLTNLIGVGQRGVVTALPAAERAVLVHLGQALALDGDTPDLREHVAWMRGGRPVPAPYQATLARARQSDADWPLG